jgi:poly-gamma-glutamate synthesis protein (capsule biosynthesis protein)
MPMTVLFLGGDVMTGRGVDQVLMHHSEPTIDEAHVKDAREYVTLAEQRSGPIPRAVPPSYPWGEGLSVLERASPDVRIINLETAITSSCTQWEGKDIHYRMNPQNIDCLTSAGIDVCVLANNHVLDYGYAGLDETLETLQRVRIAMTGAGRTSSEAVRPALFPTREGRVIVFGLGEPGSGIPASWAAAPDRPGVAFVPQLTKRTASSVARQVAAIKESRDLVVASIHWGGNWGYRVPKSHVRFAHRLIDAGVDIVHGHSSHHPRPIEVYRERLVLYGCGDLLDDYEGIGGYEEFRDDLVLLYVATVDQESGKLEGLTMVPMRIVKFRLQAASETETSWLSKRLAAICADFGTRVVRDDGGPLRLRLASQLSGT